MGVVGWILTSKYLQYETNDEATRWGGGVNTNLYLQYETNDEATRWGGVNTYLQVSAVWDQWWSH